MKEFKISGFGVCGVYADEIEAELSYSDKWQFFAVHVDGQRDGEFSVEHLLLAVLADSAEMEEYKDFFVGQKKNLFDSVATVRVEKLTKSKFLSRFGKKGIRATLAARNSATGGIYESYEFLKK